MTMIIAAHTRLLLQAASDDEYVSSSPSSMIRRPTSVDPRPHFDTSMTLTVVILLTALFFLAFFSVYIRRFAASEPPPSRPERRKEGTHVTAGKSLPLLAYGRAAMHGMVIADDCPICLTEFNEREDVKVVPYCGHVFHPRCIDTWLRTKMTCPLCRSAQLFGGKETRLNIGDTWRDEVRTRETSAAVC